MLDGTHSIFFQLFEPESSTFTYIIGDQISREVAIIDPVLETLDRDVQLLKELNVKLKYILDTHVHADHITSARRIQGYLGGEIGMSAHSNVRGANLHLRDEDIISLGNKTIRVIETPGHTNSCLSFYFEGKIFTGDTLLIRGSGRTDFQEGSKEKLFHSVREKIFSLPDDTQVYPAHDYKGFTSSTIALEKTYNPRLNLNLSFNDFSNIMDQLKLSYPKKIDTALPNNLYCGVKPLSVFASIQHHDSVPEISTDELQRVLGTSEKFTLIDVRRPEEFTGELGHIAGAKLFTLGENLTKELQRLSKNDNLIFICRSGQRSQTATMESLNLGFTNVANLMGGMIDWNEKKFHITKEST